MTTIHSARCACGFHSTVSAGGVRVTFKTKSVFPFYCDSCGLVSVNVHAEKIVCPNCYSSKVNQYGIPPISLGKSNVADYPVVQCFRYEAYANGNLCPKCKEMTLIFEPSSAMFD